jgi:hypothetical protein
MSAPDPRRAVTSIKRGSAAGTAQYREKNPRMPSKSRNLGRMVSSCVGFLEIRGPMLTFEIYLVSFVARTVN